MENWMNIQMTVRTGIRAGRGCAPTDEKCCMTLLSEDGSVSQNECGYGAGTAQFECLAAMNAHPEWDILGIHTCA